MTYCIAWKKKKKVYMIADSATSSMKDDIKSEVNTFGEAQGLYGNYMVQEGVLKIYRVSENIAVGFAGNQNIALEAIESIQTQLTFDSINNILKRIESTYGGTKEMELLIAASVAQDDNHIYYFNGNVIKEIEDFIAIGSGSECDKITGDVRWYINDLYTKCNEKFDYLASIISYLQCFSIKNKLYKYGVGGVFSGIVVDTKVRWCKDLLYYIYDDNILEGKSVSVISRKNSVFSSTDIDGGIRFILNKFTDLIYWNDPYYKEAIIKALNYKNPIYVIFYSNDFNHTIFTKVDGWMHNNMFRRWIHRGEDKVDFAYTFAKGFSDFLSSKQKNNDESPTFSYVGSMQCDYIEHEDMISMMDISEDRKFDYELKLYNYKNYDQNLFVSIRRDLEKYKNIIIIDFDFFCDSVQEKIEKYKYANISIENLDLVELVDKFIIQIASNDFNDYGILVIRKRDDNRIIDGMSMVEFFGEYKNCIILEAEQKEYSMSFCGTTLEIIKNYYINEKFFVMDKIIIISDNININNTLKLAPEFNLESENPDIILVRNINHLTKMDGRFKYVVIDVLVAFMLGLNYEEFGLLESGFPIN